MSGKKGGKVKHIPQRTCVICRETIAKRQLTRIVRTPDGDIQIDPTGKRAGRGAYLCDKYECWDKAIQSDKLAQALKANITTDARQQLRRYRESQQF